MSYWDAFATDCANWHRRQANEAPNKRLRQKNERAERFWRLQIGG